MRLASALLALLLAAACVAPEKHDKDEQIMCSQHADFLRERQPKKGPHP
jgi:hypothetical protein